MVLLRRAKENPPLRLGARGLKLGHLTVSELGPALPNIGKYNNKDHAESAVRFRFARYVLERRNRHLILFPALTI